MVTVIRPPNAPLVVKGARIFVAAATYYKGIVDELTAGAAVAIRAAEATAEMADIPGAFELPAAIALAAKCDRFDGYIALGCVIRGETTHYDYVCGESARGLMDLSIREGLSIGYGILTVENEAQAVARADRQRGDKGGEAARACLAMIDLKRRLAQP